MLLCAGVGWELAEAGAGDLLPVRSHLGDGHLSTGHLCVCQRIEWYLALLYFRVMQLETTIQLNTMSDTNNLPKEIGTEQSQGKCDTWSSVLTCEKQRHELDDKWLQIGV